MSRSFAFSAEPVAISEAIPRKSSTDRLILTLLSVGMTAAFVSLVVLQIAVKAHPKPDDSFLAPTVEKPQLYYIAHGIHLSFILLAGMIGLISADFREIIRGYRTRFFLLIAAALLMTARGYSLADLLSTRLVDIDGPFPFVISSLVFVGVRRSSWDFLNKAIIVIAIALSCTTLVFMLGLRSFTREEAVFAFGGTLNNLFWPASWTALMRYRPKSTASRLRFVPILIYGIGSLFAQTRLNFVMIFALIAVYGYLQYRRRIPQASTWLVGITAIIWVTLFVAVFLTNSSIVQRLENVAVTFSTRFDEDTRTGQLQAFAEDVPLRDLVLGRGSFARWNWDGLLWGGADLGYLTLLFYGGIPLLLSYFAAHIAPCFKKLRTSTNDLQMAAAGVVFLYGLRMFSSEYPYQELGYYPVLSCVGMCIFDKLPGKGGQPLSGSRVRKESDFELMSQTGPKWHTDGVLVGSTGHVPIGNDTSLFQFPSAAPPESG